MVRVSHACSVPIAVSSIVQTIQSRLRPHIPGLKLFTILRSNGNVRKRLQTMPHPALIKSELHMQAAQELSQLASLLLHPDRVAMPPGGNQFFSESSSGTSSGENVFFSE